MEKENLIKELSRKYNEKEIMVKIMIKETLKYNCTLEETKEKIENFFEKK